jgi:hypothetical protein
VTAYKTRAPARRRLSGSPRRARPFLFAADGHVRLPADVRPTRQRVELHVVPERARFSGRVEIALELDRPRQDLWISARELTLTRGTLSVGGRSLPLSLAADDAREQTRLCAALVAAQRKSATEFFSTRRP